MSSRPLKHLADCTLLHDLAEIVAQDRITTVRMLEHIAEVGYRKLYAPAGYPSMYKYCVHELHMSDDVAYKRVKAAYAGRHFPAIYAALADGRLHLTAVYMLAPHLNRDTAEGLVAAATHKTTAQIRLLIAERFPKPDLPTLLRAIAAPTAGDALAVRPVVPSTVPNAANSLAPLDSNPVVPSNSPDTPQVMVPVSSPVSPYTEVAPCSPGRFTLQLTMGQVTHDLLREAQALLGHAVPSGDVEAVLQRALGEMVEGLRKQKFAETARPRAQRGGTNTRQIPAEVLRAVWKRDGGRCTFVGDTGRRCEERTRVELDHVVPVARGGQSTTDNLRLLCRVHNQYEAECAFGAEFMAGKREQGRRKPAERTAPIASSLA